MLDWLIKKLFKIKVKNLHLRQNDIIIIETDDIDHGKAYAQKLSDVVDGQYPILIKSRQIEVVSLSKASKTLKNRLKDSLNA